MRSDSDRVRDILESIQKIERYARRGREVFDRDELVQTWIIHHIQTLGEAVGRIPEDLRAKFPGIPWPAIIAMRNVLVHDYFGIDLEEVWGTATRDIPRLKPHVEAILAELESHSGGSAQ